MSTIDELYFPNPVQPTGNRPTNQRNGSKELSGDPFDKLLKERLSGGELRFSAHATERLAQRGIKLTAEEMQKLQGAVSDVAAKGGRDSLIMVGDAALVVSVTNRTVITAMDRKSMEGNIFTNIDSAVML
ncbi:MAG TPA: TIGR02530 family flagellar biosynthesis protein [Geobacterales bacterium]|nr:TIGR02530 family flagellar biosynthesis protein [Geobacterales bacterium]